MKTEDFIQVAVNGIAQTVQMVEDGEHDVLDAASAIRAVSDMCSDALKQISDQITNEVEKRGEPVTMNGYRMEYRKGTRRFDYKHIVEWEAVKKQLSYIEERAKQLALSGTSGVTEDGEIIEPAKITWGSDTCAFTKIKQ